MKKALLTLSLSLFFSCVFAQSAKRYETATFGMGCFWCTEAVFQNLKGVISTTSGYSGGRVTNPTYEQVSAGNTGHAEVEKIVFDPTVISYNKLLQVFFTLHDPTTLNRQGADVGTQYRSVIFYHNSAQKAVAQKYITTFNANNTYGSRVVTQIVPAAPFYPAENYHQQYFAMHGSEPYCRQVIVPKIEKVKKLFKTDLKTYK